MTTTLLAGDWIAIIGILLPLVAGFGRWMFTMQMGMTEIKGRLDAQRFEDEHCKHDRGRLTEHVGKLFGTTELHGQEIAVLRGEAKTWRKGEAHGA